MQNQLPTLKDNDFIKQGIKVVIGSSAKEKLYEVCKYMRLNYFDNLKFSPKDASRGCWIFNKTASNGLLTAYRNS